jgi:sulfonate transport system substrate-binding protein
VRTISKNIFATAPIAGRSSARNLVTAALTMKNPRLNGPVSHGRAKRSDSTSRIRFTQRAERRMKRARSLRILATHYPACFLELARHGSGDPASFRQPPAIAAAGEHEIMTQRFRLLRLKPVAGVFAAASRLLAATASFAQDKPSVQIRIGLQKSSTLIAVLRANGELEKALAPLGVKVLWAEFSSGLPPLESLGVGNLDFGADVADTVPIFAQAAGSKLAYVAEESASPSAQAILVAKNSPIKTLADLKGKKVAVTKGAGSHYLLLAALGKAGLNFKDIAPAYLAPADGRAAFVSNNVDAWVAWDPFLTSAQQQSGAKVLSDGNNGLASYKRYYLASETFADRRSDVLNIVFAKLRDTGKWVKANPKEAATLLAGLWGIDAPTVEEANSHRSYGVGAVKSASLTEQQKIANAFFDEGLIPKKIDTTAVKIWTPNVP